MTGPAGAVIRGVGARQTIGRIPLNVVVTETHLVSNVVTRAPVDSEADRGLHIITQPREVSIEAIVSATSDSYEDQAEGIVTREDRISWSPPTGPVIERPSLSTQYGVQVITRANSSYDKYSSFWARINQLNASKELFEYTSDLGVYKNMVFDSIEVVRDDHEWITFTALMVEFVLSGVTRDRWLATSQLDDSRDPANTGTKAPTQVEEVNPLPDVSAATGPPSVATRLRVG